jgi:hypothetical protein
VTLQDEPVADAVVVALDGELTSFAMTAPATAAAITRAIPVIHRETRCLLRFAPGSIRGTGDSRLLRGVIAPGPRP